MELEIVDGTIADELADACGDRGAGGDTVAVGARNLFGEAERIAARAASASTRGARRGFVWRWRGLARELAAARREIAVLRRENAALRDRRST